MTAVKNGANIFVEGTGNTLASVYTDIADPLYFDNPSTNLYQLVGNRRLYVRPGGELTIGNSGDFSFAETLEFDPTSNGGAGFTVNHGGAFYIYGASTLDMSTTAFYTTSYVYGKIRVEGDATYRPLFDHSGRILYNWESTTPAHAATDTWYWEHVDVQRQVGTPFSFYMLSMIDGPEQYFKDIDFDAVPGGGPTSYAGSYGLYVNPEIVAGAESRVHFSDCTFQHYNSYGIGLFGSAPFSFVRCTVQYNRLWGLLVQGNSWVPQLLRHELASVIPVGMVGQSFPYFEDCVFTSNYGNTRDVLLNPGCIVAFKGCTFNSASVGIFGTYGGIALVLSGNVFNGASVFTSATKSTALWSFELDLTVIDSVGDPIENALVIARQKDGKERYLFDTDAAGKPITNPHMSGKIALTWREEWAAGSYDLWSDTSNSTYHDVTVSAPGYITQTIQQVMDQDRVLPVSLATTGAGSIGDTLDAIQARVNDLQDR
jgi:hypothetical protein